MPDKPWQNNFKCNLSVAWSDGACLLKRKRTDTFLPSGGDQIKASEGNTRDKKTKQKKTFSGENLLANYGTTISKPFKCSKKIKYNLLP